MILGICFILAGIGAIVYGVWMRLQEQKLDTWDKVNYFRLYLGGAAFILLGILALTGAL